MEDRKRLGRLDLGQGQDMLDPRYEETTPRQTRMHEKHGSTPERVRDEPSINATTIKHGQSGRAPLPLRKPPGHTTT